MSIASTLDSLPEGDLGRAGDLAPSDLGNGATHPRFPEIYKEQVRFAWRALRRFGVSDAEVEDACQDVFVIVHSKLHAFDWRRSMRAWVFGISVRVAAKYRRPAFKRHEQSHADPDAPQEPDQFRALERRRAEQRLEQVLDTLSEPQRAVFVLFELEQLTMSEVAGIVGCPLQTAYSRLRAARNHVEGAIRRLVDPS